MLFPQSSEKGRVYWEKVSLTSWLASLGKVGGGGGLARTRSGDGLVSFLESTHNDDEEEWESVVSAILDLKITSSSPPGRGS